MREFQEKKRFRKFLYSRFTVVLLVILIVFFSRAAWGVYQKERESAASVLQAQSELQKLQEREDKLNAEITRLSTDEGVEEEIRAKYGVSKKGEEMLIIVDPRETATSTGKKAETTWQKIQRMLHLIK